MFDSLTRLGASNAEEEYEIAKSLRFNDDDSPHLTFSPSSATNRKTFTFSFWTKLGPTAATSGNANLFHAGANSITDGFFEMRFGAAGFRVRYCDGGGGGNAKYKTTNAKYKDVAKWYHCVCAVDTTQGTADDRIKFYINGVQETDLFDDGSNTAAVDQNHDFLVNNNQEHVIGYGKGWNGAVDGYTDQLLAEWHFIDGSALTPDNFGKTKASTGEWIPIEYTGSHGTNGYYLSFGDSSALGNDDSSNSNNWSPNNFGTSNDHDNDSLTDSPTSNYCVLDCLDLGGASVTNGGLETNTASGSGHNPFWSTIGLTSGKWYCEAKAIGGFGVGMFMQLASKQEHGKIDHDQDTSSWTGSATAPQPFKAYNYLTQYGNLYHGNQSSGQNVADYLPDCSIDDIFMMAFDLDAGKIWWGRNGTWGDAGSGTGNPATGANPAYDNINSSPNQSDEIWCVAGMDTNTHHFSFNFGQQPWAYTPPTGFNPITTQNLPEPVIKDPSKYFDTVLYTGNGANQTISSLGFQPDLVWFKSRETTYDNEIYDSVRGVEKGLYTNTNAAEFDDDDALTAFNSNGFTVGDDPACNQSNAKILSYSWKKTAAAGFDIVGWTGNATNRTISHSLGVVPEMMIVKLRGAADVWKVYHKDLGNTKFLMLNTADAAQTESGNWNDTTPTSSVISIGTDNAVNKNSTDVIAYLFASVAGYSKVGAYYGNGNQEGPVIYTGFKPAWVLIKNTEHSNSYWNLHDNKRDTYNPVNTVIYPNTSDDEEAYSLTTASSTNKNFFSNGFQIYSTHDPEMNANDEKYIYLAFAERPFKYANTR